MPRGEYIAEHKRLVRILAHPTPRGLRSELAEQTKDLRKATHE
jgi:hypothetical protein